MSTAGQTVTMVVPSLQALGHIVLSPNADLPSPPAFSPLGFHCSALVHFTRLEAEYFERQSCLDHQKYGDWRQISVICFPL